jgi:hypothetical protein
VADRIEDYAIAGDMQSAALSGVDGSVGWLCPPRFDSEAAGGHTRQNPLG